MNGWIIVALALAVPALILVAWSWALVSGDADRRAQQMQYNVCQHEEYWPWWWTEDGWVKVCRGCGNIAYGGDDATPVEPE